MNSQLPLNTLLQKGFLLHQQGQLLEAQSIYEEILRFDSQNFDALHLLAMITNTMQNNDQALELIAKALKINENYSPAWLTQGNIYKSLKQFNSALDSYNKAIEVHPEFAEAHYNLGTVLQAINEFDQAIRSYERAVQLKQDLVQAHYNLGVIYFEQKEFEKAIASYSEAIQHKSNYAEAYNNLGNTYKEQGNSNQALLNYNHTLELNPNFTEALCNRGLLLQENKHVNLAIHDFEKALALHPLFENLTGMFLHAKMLACDWEGISLLLEILKTQIRKNEKVAQPFAVLGLIDSLEIQALCVTSFTTPKYLPRPVLGPCSSQVQKTKIRIGYFSADFGNHPVSFLTAELFELHDRNHFEVFAFSFREQNHDEWSTRLLNGFDHFIDARQYTDIQVAKLARDLHIDIAIDLGGFTTFNHADVFTYRPAPIQLSYLGFLGTMGPHFMDYIIADQTIIPQESQHFYSEKIIYLPSYQVNDSKRKISDRAFSRNELGLPETGFVFCCFNNNFKITPNTFDGWMRILHAVHDSVLFLYAENPWAESNLKLEAQKRGILPTRLIFGQRLARDEYLARYQVCDLFLDTLPYNAGTTASDALWAGLPVLTLMGESFASRVAASLLQAIHLPELITTSQSDYEALAIHIGNHPQLLLELKKKLGNNRLTTPLFNTAQFTKSLESAYTQIINNHCKQKPLDHVVISF